MSSTYPSSGQVTAAQKNHMALVLIGQIQERVRSTGTGVHWTRIYDATGADASQNPIYQAVLSQVPAGQVDTAPGAWLFALGNDGTILGIPGTRFADTSMNYHGHWSDFSYWGDYGEATLWMR